MKPIAHYRQLTFRYLRQQKKRSILTVVGIVLSVALMFGSGIMGQTLKAEMLQNIKNAQGDFHVAYTHVSEAQVAQLQSNARIERVGVMQKLGLMRNEREIELNVVGADEGLLDILGLRLAEGKLPESAGEIALERWYVENDPAKPKLGDRIKLTIEPLEKDAAAGAKQIETEAVLVGLFQNKTGTQLSGRAYATMTLQAAAALRGGADAHYDAGVRFKPHVGIQRAIQDTKAAIGATDESMQPNTALLTAMGESGNSANNRAIDVAQSIVIGIILIATVAVIYNSFHISVLERIRQFGVLRSIGMTPRQIRVVVFREATVLALIGIPVGLLAGWAAIKAVLAVFVAIDATVMFSGHTMVVPWSITAGAVVLGLCAVYASAFGPAWAAGRVSPLVAIMHGNRFNKEKVTRRKRRLVRAVLGITGKMAVDSLKRNRRRFRITLFSMSIGIALFVFFYSFMTFIQLSQSRIFSKDFALEQGYGTETPQFTPQQFEQVSQIPGVRDVYRVAWQTMYTRVPVDKLTNAFKKKLGQLGETFGFAVELRGYRAADLALSRDRLIRGSMNADEMDRENGVVVSQRGLSSGGTFQYTDLRVGDTIPISFMPIDGSQQERVVNVKVLGIIDKMPLNYSGGSEQFTLVTTEKVFRELTGYPEAFNRFDLVLDRTADKTVVKERLQQIADRVKSGRVLDFLDNAERKSTLMIAILLYGLVTVISVISAINIINTISTNLILRTREFGTMRAVGMTMRQMRRMIVYESVSYGAYATVYGGASGALLAYWLYTKLNRIQDLPYSFPWEAVVGSGAAAVLISLIASRVPLRRIERMDVVQAIRTEE